MNVRRQFLRFAGAVVAVLLITLSNHDAGAQTTKTIKIIVPNPPGGAFDVLGRLLGEQISRLQRKRQ